MLRDLEPADLDLMAGCGHNEVFEAGTFLAREDEPADRFFVVRAGQGGARAPRADRPAADRDARRRRPRRMVVAVPAAPVGVRRRGPRADAGGRDRRGLPAGQVRRRSGVRLPGDEAVRPGASSTGSRPRGSDCSTSTGPAMPADVESVVDWRARPRSPVGPMVPTRYRVADREQETADTVTLALAPIDEPIDEPEPGQFTMLYAFGVGEVPISVSGCPRRRGRRCGTPSAPSARRPGRCAASSRARSSASAARSAPAGPCPAPRGPTC